MENPVDVLLIVSYDAGFNRLIPDKPKIEINRHQRPRIILATMFCQRSAVDEVLHLSVRNLSYECMPAGVASTAGVKDVVLFPVGFRTESPPGSRK